MNEATPAPAGTAADDAPVSYGSYLRLPALLSLQEPRSAAHDEMLFVVIHQAAELWMKLSLHELGAARDHLARDDLGPAFKIMARVSRIQSQLIQSWEVLATMTPADYAEVREHLGASSGFQSAQYRLLEFILGHRQEVMARLHDDDADAAAALRAELVRPSLYDEALRVLARRGLAVPAAVLDRAPQRPHEPSPAVEACWRAVYREPARWWDLYELAEKLVDLEYHLQLWRFGHLKTVERVIGFKRGTGGTPGVGYLAKVIEQRFFPELLSVRTTL